MNKSSKKRTLSETIEDELLTGTTHNDDVDDDEPEAKRRSQSQTSDNDENEEVNIIDFISFFLISFLK